MMFEPGAPRDTARLEDYLRAARERWPLIILGVVLVVVPMWYLLNQREATYTALSRVAVGPTPATSVNANNLERPNLEREREILASNAIADLAIEGAALDTARDDLLAGLNVSFRPDSDVLRVEYTDVDPDEAAATANAVSLAYVTQRESAAELYYADQISEFSTNVADLEAEIETIQSDVAALELQRATLQSAEEVDTTAVQAATSEVTRLNQVRSELTNEVREISRSLRTLEQAASRRPVAAEVLGDATAPVVADGLSTSLLLLGGAITGLLVGFAIAFLADRLDTRAKSEGQLELALGASVLGSVPRFGLRSGSGAASVIMLSDDRSNRAQAARESFRRLASSLAFVRTSESISSVIVTSAKPGEGKTTFAANLAVALAQAGNSVVLVSADMRRPTLEERFGVPLRPGLSDYLGRNADISAVDASGVPGLLIIPAGAPPDNPGELLASPQFSAVVSESTGSANFVIIDTPPVLSTADANAAAMHADGVLVVVDARRTSTEELLEVRSGFERTGAKLLGSVVNRKRFRRQLFGRGGYAYYSRNRRDEAEAIKIPPSPVAPKSETVDVS